jgi:hypothetical protein
MVVIDNEKALHIIFSAFVSSSCVCGCVGFRLLKHWFARTVWLLISVCVLFDCVRVPVYKLIKSEQHLHVQQQ